MLTKILIYAVGILGALGVACGAFGAHFMEGRVLPENIEIWQTAVMYQFFHVIPVLPPLLFMVRTKPHFP